MIFIRNVFILLLVSMLNFSCLAKKNFFKCRDNLKSCEKKNLLQKLEIIKSIERVKSLTDQLILIKNQSDSFKSNLENCLVTSTTSSMNINKLIRQIQSSNDYIKKLTEARFKQDSLNKVLSNKLKRSLENFNNSDINIYIKKGVVFISLSDKMLYRSGSYDILPRAEVVLGKVAQVINDYKDYDVLVEGHTDSDKLKYSLSSSSFCLKDNWDLSVMRATSVVRLLQSKFGVSPNRMTAGGRSEFIPKASNLNQVGKSINRRTEIIILPKLDQFMKLMDVKL